MKYVALLRGINVGGNSKVDMKQLAALFESLGLESVKTYINSGNVIFESKKLNQEKLSGILEEAIEKHFGFSVKVLVKSYIEIKKIVDAIPGNWVNNDVTKCDVLFLWDEFDNENVLSDFTIKSDIDQVKYVKGAVLWCIEKVNATKSGLQKIILNKPLYLKITVRNCNTARKLFELMEAK